MQRRPLILGSAAYVTACSGTWPTKPLLEDEHVTQTLHAPKPSQNFNFPYILQVPVRADQAAIPYLIVEGNNSGPISPEVAPHIQPTSELARKGLGGRVSVALQTPLLMPVFPRDTDLYTHSLGRSTMLSPSPSLRRLDRQLLAMARDAQLQLRQQGLNIQHKLLLTGFSASAKFATRLAAMHPNEVAAVVAGGLNGFVILPVENLAGTPLPYPLGVDDLQHVCGRAFDRKAWTQVKQLLFMGALDTNDAVDFVDSYSQNDRQIIHQLLGRQMMPDRWAACERVYRSASSQVVFKTYPNMGHGTNGLIHGEAAAFFREVSTAARLRDA